MRSYYGTNHGYVIKIERLKAGFILYCKWYSKTLSKMSLNPTPLRVSTRVITAHAGTPMNLNLLFEHVKHILIPLWYPGEGILKMEHDSQIIGQGLKDAFSKRRVSEKTFFNQSTLVVRKRISVDKEKYADISPDSMVYKEVNVKLFANGGIQMTGVPEEGFAEETGQWLLGELWAFQKKHDVLVFGKEPVLQKFSTQLINSDYDICYNVKREAIHQILSRVYGLFSTFEGTIYQGVNTKYYYNETNTNPDKEGQCMCSNPLKCKGQGSGVGDFECKRITMSIFQTGKIIITGARHFHQIEAAYRFLNRVFTDHADEVLRKPLTLETEDAGVSASAGSSPTAAKKARKTRVRKISLTP
jgi:hypothetical protein